MESSFTIGAEVKAEPAFAKLKGSTVRSIQSTPDKTLWFATNRGIYLCRAGSDCALAAPGFEARFLARDADGKQNELWCGTSGSGLLKISLDDQLGPPGQPGSHRLATRCRARPPFAKCFLQFLSEKMRTEAKRC